jgi:hypothetical protein
MLFTWNTENLCIIFRRWHIRDFTTLIFSLVAIVLLTAGYEALREGSRRYEIWVEKKTEETPSKLTLVLSVQSCGDLQFVCWFRNRKIVRLNLMEMLLRGPPSFGQGETRSKLARERMLSRQHYMPFRPSMPLCLCECSRFRPTDGKLMVTGYFL